MINRFELLPNEIFFQIYSYLTWAEILVSFWSLNHRIDSLICSIFSTNPINFNQLGLSYKKLSTILLPIIFHSSSLSISIKSIHFDGRNSNFHKVIRQYLYNNEQILRFHNLKSIHITRCLISTSLFQTLLTLIKHQLDDLALTFDEDIFRPTLVATQLCRTNSCIKKAINALKTLIRKFFSRNCRLTSLRLDISHDQPASNIHQCLISTSVSNTEQTCVTLRYLYLRLKYTCFLECLIERIPNIEQLSVIFESLDIRPRSESDIKLLIKSNKNWFEKTPKLNYFTIKTSLNNDFQLFYLKWLLNNLYHIKKLNIHLQIDKTYDKHILIINQYSIDANFIHQYCLPDIANNIIDFHFYITSISYSSLINTEKIINSFKIHPFFIDHQWTNVICFFDPLLSYQHLSSYIVNIPKISNDIVYYPNIFTWPRTSKILIQLQPSFYSFFENFNETFPNVSHIQIYRDSIDLVPSNYSIPFEIRQPKITNIQLRNVTRLDLGRFASRVNVYDNLSNNEVKIRARVFARLISMPVQLKYLLICNIKLFYEIIQYGYSVLTLKALRSVKCAEFGVSSCHYGSIESVCNGEDLVDFLQNYMPSLQTLRIWRPDDFPWTSVRPKLRQGYYRGVDSSNWSKFITTSESIAEHANIFEKDLIELFSGLEHLGFLDIYGDINRKKVKSYRSMVEKSFPDSNFHIDTMRFRLWR